MFKDEYIVGKLYRATFIIDTGVDHRKCMSFFVLKTPMTVEGSRESLIRIINDRLNSDEFLETETLEIKE